MTFDELRGRVWDDFFGLLQDIEDGKEPPLDFTDVKSMEEVAAFISAALDDKIDPDADEEMC